MLALSARRPILPSTIAMHGNRVLRNRPARFEDEDPGDTTAATFRCAPQTTQRLAKRRTERFLLWNLRSVS